MKRLKSGLKEKTKKENQIDLQEIENEKRILIIALATVMAADSSPP